MRKLLKRMILCFVLAASVWCCSVLLDRIYLNDQVIRLHVVANSNDQVDQQIKLQVRDAVINSLRSDMKDIADVGKAEAYLQENLPKIEALVNQTLKQIGSEDTAVVSYGKESFLTRYYDTFALPAGIYDALRITIGEGNGKNWWCVVFPSLCIPATSEDFEVLAADSGFSENLTSALTGDAHYQLRFFFLDSLGRLENKLRKESITPCSLDG